MNIEKQVVSLELSKKLKLAGYKQEGLWWWAIGKSNKGSCLIQGKPKKDTMFTLDKPVGKQHYIQEIKETFIAPTVAELINMLTKLRKGDIIIPEKVSNVADYLAQEVLNEKSKV